QSQLERPARGGDVGGRQRRGQRPRLRGQQPRRRLPSGPGGLRRRRPLEQRQLPRRQWRPERPALGGVHWRRHPRRHRPRLPPLKRPVVSAAGAWGATGLWILSDAGIFLAGSPNWNGRRGAVTSVDASAGVRGVVSAANSLVGSFANDQVYETVRLNNGSYV